MPWYTNFTFPRGGKMMTFTPLPLFLPGFTDISDAVCHEYPLQGW